MSALETVLERAQNLRKNSAGYLVSCPCPGHGRGRGDKTPSVSVGMDAEGNVLAHCHAGCATEDVMTAWGLTMADLFEGGNGHHNGRKRPRGEPTGSWHIKDMNGKVQAVHVRFDLSDGDKECLWRLPGEKRWGLQGRKLSTLPLYGTERVQDWPGDLPLVVVAEGEKATDALLEAGFAALGTVTGAGGTPGTEALKVLRDRRVVLWSDNDAEGRAHMRRVAKGLQVIAAEVRIFEWEDAPPKGDAADYPGVLSRSRKAIDELLSEMAALPVWEPDPVGVLLTDVEPEEVHWLWDRRIPLGKLTVLDGNPGDGKSVWTADVAARVSNGRAWPDGGRCPVGGAVICSGEDGVADTILPRLIASGGDPSKVLALSTVPDPQGNERTLSIPEDIPVIERGIRRVRAVVAVIDPLMAFLSGETNAHKDQDVRRAMAPLAKMAERTGAAIIVIRHLNKAPGINPLYRGGGSIGIIGAARSGLVVGRHPEDEELRVLAGVKSNLSLPPESLVYHIETAANGAAHIVYRGTTETKAVDLLKAPTDEEDRSALSGAKEFLLAELTDGPMTAKQVEKSAGDAGIRERTLRRAKSTLGIRSTKEADGSWTWSLPGKDAQDGQVPTNGSLGTVGNLASDKDSNSVFLPEDGQGGQAYKVGHVDSYLRGAGR